MSEDETKEPEPAPEETKEEEQAAPVKSTMVDEAKDTVERMEKANVKREELILREEKLQAEKALGGTADAGSKGLTDDEKVIEGAKKLLKGTGYETMFDEPKSS